MQETVNISKNSFGLIHIHDFVHHEINKFSGKIRIIVIAIAHRKDQYDKNHIHFFGILSLSGKMLFIGRSTE